MIEKDVLRLDISVNDISLVQIADSLEDLTENFPLKFIILFQWVLAHEVFQRLTVAVLHLNV